MSTFVVKLGIQKWSKNSPKILVIRGIRIFKSDFCNILVKEYLILKCFIFQFQLEFSSSAVILIDSLSLEFNLGEKETEFVHFKATSCYYTELHFVNFYCKTC